GGGVALRGHAGGEGAGVERALEGGADLGAEAEARTRGVGRVARARRDRGGRRRGIDRPRVGSVTGVAGRITRAHPERVAPVREPAVALRAGAAREGGAVDRTLEACTRLG